MRACLQELLKRLQEKHGKCAEALTNKAAADAQAADAQHRAKATQDHAKAARNKAKVDNKVALQAEKDNDAAQKELQELQLFMEPKRARTHAATADDDEDYEKQS